jgi:hypothetical protein
MEVGAESVGVLGTQIDLMRRRAEAARGDSLSRPYMLILPGLPPVGLEPTVQPARTCHRNRRQGAMRRLRSGFSFSFGGAGFLALRQVNLRLRPK